MRDESRPALPVNGQNGLSSLNGRNGAHPEAATAATKALPRNLAVKCPNCRELLVGKDWEKNLRVCVRCGHHSRLSARERIELLFDDDSFEAFGSDLHSADPLSFVSRTQPYPAYLADYRARAGMDEAVVVGQARMDGLPVIAAVMDSNFVGGSMGSVVGERVTQAIERAAEERVPLLIVATSGGARMQEGLFALMQMAKTAAALARLAERAVPFICLLTDPTTGGVWASFAALADVIVAEPGAMVGFAGPRVIEQFMHQRLPKDTATAEFALKHGMIDAVAHRRDVRPTLVRLLRMFGAARPA
ncbi:MAG TPA: acetyl-CoA carboxylase, carboxyltransferase subunit beta [Ktedonobacterales bacterium]|nr:acetyl-CoA carboxylase, carboxyltransferase subunit beta [Ktedonobacterales bacterium]